LTEVGIPEIGGYLELEEFRGREYHTGALALNSGRSALACIIKARSIRRLFLPYYICECIPETCGKLSVDCTFYHIGEDFLPDLDWQAEDGEALLAVNFYGTIDGKGAERLRERYRAVILDNTQAFFSEPVPGVDTFCTCRKYFGVPDGAYLYTAAHTGGELETDVSAGRMGHILGRFEGPASEYFEVFRHSEARMAEEGVRLMSRLTHNLLRAIDYESAASARERNFARLDERLGHRNALAPVTGRGPFAYPFLCGGGMAIRKKLADRKIYIPTLWPNVLNLPGNWIEYRNASGILPLPCDQRYGEREMDYVSEALLDLLK
jgi:hypothetical protein